MKPAAVGDNGYRYYEQDTVLRLQQIRFYQELDFSLDQIRNILDKSVANNHFWFIHTGW